MYKLFLFLLNLTPIINISNDENFGSLDNFDNFRVSFFTLHFGTFIFHLISLSICKKPFTFKLDLIRKITICSVPSYKLILDENKINQFNKSILNKDDKELDILIEFIKEKLSAAREPLSISNDKIIANLSILTAYAAFVGYLSNESIKINMTSWHIVILSLTLILLFQSFFVIFNGIGTRAISKSTVKSLIESTSKLTVAKNYYYDLIHTIRSSNLLSTSVLNARKFLIALLISSLILFIFTILPCQSSIKNINPVKYDMYLDGSQLNILKILELNNKLKKTYELYMVCGESDIYCTALEDYLISLGKVVLTIRVSEDVWVKNKIYLSEMFK